MDVGIDAPATPCLDKWKSGTVRLTAPVEVPVINSSPGSDRDPWLSHDQLTLYWSSDRQSSFDLWFSRRGTPTSAFGAPARDGSLSSSSADLKVAMTADMLVAVLASDRQSQGNFELFQATRTGTGSSFPAPSTGPLGAINSSDSQFDPELNRSGTRIYYTDGNPQHISVASRANVTATFGAPQSLINSGTADADPNVSDDELLILFTSLRPGSAGIDLWYATRATTADTFGTPARLVDVDTSSAEGDPALSSDGCTLYFASDRLGGTYHIFVSTVVLP